MLFRSIVLVAHPQGNGQVERTNALVLDGIKPRLIEPLERTPGGWLEELPAVLWSLRTTPNRSTGYTPFFLVYGAEAVLPADIEFDSPRVTLYTEAEVKEAREDDIVCLKKQENWQRPDWQSISKASNAIIAGRYPLEHSERVIWC